MSTTDTFSEWVAGYVSSGYASPQWVANYYGVTKMKLHRVTERGGFEGCVVRIRNTGGRRVILYDIRTLPTKFPKPRDKRLRLRLEDAA